MYGTTVNNKGKIEKNKFVKEGPCIFPFKHKWKTHNKCIASDKGPKCATSVNKNNTLKTYGYCVSFKSKSKKKKFKKKKLKIVDKDKSPELSAKTKNENLQTKTQKKQHTLKKNKTEKKKKLKKKLKIITENKEMTQSSMKASNTLNQGFISALGELENFMQKKGDFMRARAYQKAQEAIMAYPNEIQNVNEIAKLKGVGKTIMAKLEEFKKTGKIQALEKEKADPIHVFTNIYGVGPKKAKQLLNDGITTLDQLKKKQDDVLTETQKMGLKYYDDLEKRIPRSEIDSYQTIFNEVFNNLKFENSKMEIVGSYRRGNKNSGDIDVIITDSKNDKSILKKFVDALWQEDIIIYKLTDGSTKILVITKLPNKPARRVDFLYSPPSEFAFAILYFTGSKAFNVMMRHRALEKGYSLNEHGFYKMTDGKKGKKLDKEFNTEKDIFDFLDMKFKEPTERFDGRAVEILKESLVQDQDQEISSVKTVTSTSTKSSNTTVKRRSPRNHNKTLKASPKSNVADFKEKGAKFLKKLSEKQIGDMVRYANDVYFNDPDKIVLTDDEFDIIKEYLYSNYPKNIALKDIGAPIVTNSKNKVQLPFPMPSMDKIKPSSNAVGKWLEKFNKPESYVISAKLDGVSGLYSTQNAEKKLYTRGNGTIGQDISYFIPYLKLPEKQNVVIRGEFIISKNNFEKHFKGSKNARNTVAGIINRIKVDKDQMKYVDFVAYEVIEPHMRPSEQFKFLKNLNIDIVKNEEKTTIDNNYLSSTLVDWREKYQYDIDGIIVSHNRMYAFRSDKNPEHAFAFKMVLKDQTAEAKVVDVIWSISKHGFLKPKIQIEPISLKGVTIEFATAFNAAFVEKHKLGIGALVEISRSGDVIPHIEKVVKPAQKALMPDVPYKWNKTHVDILLEDKSSNKIVQSKTMLAFFKVLEVDGIGPGNIQKIIDAGYNTIPAILAMSKEDFLNIPGFKDKTASKLHSGIKNKVEQISLAKLMKASHIFGRGLGEKKITPILKKFPDILTSAKSKEDKIKDVLTVSGIGEETSKLFVDNIPEFLQFLVDSKLMKKLKQNSIIKPKNTSHPLYEKKIVLTGYRDKQLTEDIENLGGTIGSSVSKTTFVVITKNIDDNTSKLLKAKELNIPIMTPESFKSKYIK